MSAVDTALRMAEGVLQKWLARKPPPAYVERHLLRPDEPDNHAEWRKLLLTLNPELADLFSEMHVLRLSDRVSIGLLNYYAYKDELAILADAERHLRAFLSSFSGLSTRQNAVAL